MNADQLAYIASQRVAADQRATSARLINFVRFVSRDGLQMQQPFGKSAAQITNKAFRTLHSSIVAPGKDERPPPQPEDADFKTRTRVYMFAGIEVEPGTGVTVAVYAEE